MAQRCPPIQRCAVCGQLLIHRGRRSIHESASYLGQIVHNLLPPEMTAIDIDLFMYRREAPHLLRVFEHKSPGSTMRPGQREGLRIVARAIEHLLACEHAEHDLGFRLHPRSAVFLMQGDPHEGNQLGAHVITKLSGRGAGHDQQWACASELDILRWMAWLTSPRDVEFVRDRLRRRRVQPLPATKPA